MTMGVRVENSIPIEPGEAEIPVVLYGSRDGGVLVPIEVDNLFEYLVTIGIEHHRIHEGKAWRVFHTFSLNAAGVGYLQFNSAVVYRHMRVIGAQTDSEKWTLELIEAPTITDGTTPVNPRNANRNSAEVGGLTWYSNPTSVSGGTVFDTYYLGGGTSQGQGKSGGGVADTDEWLLLPSTKYVLKATNGGAGAGKCNVRLFYY